jgi:hypothetical protein
VRVPVGGEADARRLSESIFPSSFVVCDANYLRVGGRRPLSTLHLARLRGARPFPGAVQACVVEQAPDTLRLWCSYLISQLHYLLAQMYHMQEALGVSSLHRVRSWRCRARHTRQRMSRVSQQYKSPEVSQQYKSPEARYTSRKYGRTHKLTVEDLAWNEEEVCEGWWAGLDYDCQTA